MNDIYGLNVLGKVGLVDASIFPHKSGRIKISGSYWQAKCEANHVIEPGSEVVVINRDNITLWVTPR